MPERGRERRREQELRHARRDGGDGFPVARGKLGVPILQEVGVRDRLEDLAPRTLARQDAVDVEERAACLKDRIDRVAEYPVHARSPLPFREPPEHHDEVVGQHLALLVGMPAHEVERDGR